MMTPRPGWCGAAAVPRRSSPSLVGSRRPRSIQHRRSRRPHLGDGRGDGVPWTSKSCIAACATPICTWRRTTGRAGRPSIRSCRARKSSGESARSAPTSRASKPATWQRSAAWSPRAARARAARTGSSTFATVFTYNSADPEGTAPATYGGYSDRIVVNSHFGGRVARPRPLPVAAEA